MCSTLLLYLLVRLLLVILQVHDGFLGQFQVSLQLPLGSLQVHAELLLLFQRTLQLRNNVCALLWSTYIQNKFKASLIDMINSHHQLAALAWSWPWSEC